MRVMTGFAVEMLGMLRLEQFVVGLIIFVGAIRTVVGMKLRKTGSFDVVILGAAVVTRGMDVVKIIRKAII